MKKSALFITSLILTVLLSACSDGGSKTPNNQDKDPKKSKTSEVSGQVIDGYLVGATVFLDRNLNSKLDEGEPNTTTGAGGKYTLKLTEVERSNYPIVALVNKDTKDTGSDDTAINGKPANASGDYVLSTPPGQSVITPFTTPIMAMLKQEGILTNLDLGDKKNADLIKKLINITVKAVLSKIPKTITQNQQEFPLFENFITSDKVNKDKTQKLAEKVTVVMAKVSRHAIDKDTEIKAAGDAETAVSNAIMGDNMLEALADDKVKKDDLAKTKDIGSVVNVIKKSGKEVSIASKPERNTEYVPAINQSNTFAIYTQGVYSFDVDAKRENTTNTPTDNTDKKTTDANKRSIKIKLHVSLIDFNSDGSENFKELGDYNNRGELVQSNYHHHHDSAKYGILDNKGQALWVASGDDNEKMNIEAKGDNIVVTRRAPLLTDKTKQIVVNRFEWGVTKKDYSNKPVKKLLGKIIATKLRRHSLSDSKSRDTKILAKWRDDIANLPNTTLPVNSFIYAPSTAIQAEDIYELDGEIKPNSSTTTATNWEALNGLFLFENFRNGHGIAYGRLDTDKKQVRLYGTNKTQDLRRTLSYTESTRGGLKVITFKADEWEYPKFIAQAKYGSSTIMVNGSLKPAGQKTTSSLHLSKTVYDAIDTLLKNAGANGEIELLKPFVYSDNRHTETKQTQAPTTASPAPAHN